MLSFLAVTALSLLCSCRSSEPSFVKVEDGRFSCDDYPSHYIGTNFWYGAFSRQTVKGVTSNVSRQNLIRSSLWA